MNIVKQQENHNLPTKINNLIQTTDQVAQLATKASDPKHSPLELKTFTDQTLNYINEKMPEINQKTNSFGRQNSSYVDKLQSLQMTTKGSTMRVLRQTLSQIERKRTALKEQQQRLRKEKIDADKYIGDLEDLEDEIDELKEKLQDIETQEYYQKNDVNYREQKREYRRKLRQLQYDYENTQIELEKISMNIADSREYMEGAIKEIASFQDAYEQIKNNKGISENWDEETFEDMEPDFHVRHIFYVGYQDLKGQGRINHSTVEHAIQFGMNPEQVEAEIVEFINQQKSQIFTLAYDDFNRPYYTISGEANYNEFEDWLEAMTSKYRNYYQNAMKTLGLDTMNRDWYQFHDHQIEEKKEDN